MSRKAFPVPSRRLLRYLFSITRCIPTIEIIFDKLTGQCC
jgi:hypothetical protein